MADRSAPAAEFSAYVAEPDAKRESALLACAQRQRFEVEPLRKRIAALKLQAASAGDMSDDLPTPVGSDSPRPRGRPISPARRIQGAARAERSTVRMAVIGAFAVLVTASAAWAAPDQCPGFQGDSVPLNGTSLACSASDCSSSVGSALEEIAVQLCSLGVLPVECGRCECCRRSAVDLFTGTDVAFDGSGDQFCHIGGRGRPMGEAALCLLRDLANPAFGSGGPGIQLERSEPLAIGALTVRQHVGFVDFDVPGRRMRGYHAVTFCAPVLGCISNQTQPFTATLQQVDIAPAACRDYLYLTPSLLHVESEQLEHDVHIGIGPLTVYTPAGPVSVEPSLDYEMNLEAVTQPWACCGGKNQPIGSCTSSNEFNVDSASLGVGATLFAGLHDTTGWGWNTALGLGGRDPDPADPIWVPAPLDYPPRPDFDFSIARSPREKRPTGRFRTAVNVCYGIGESCENTISDLLGNLDIPPLSLEAFEVYVRSSLEAAFVSEFAIALDEGKPSESPDCKQVSETNLHMQSALDALGQISVKAGLLIEFVLDLGFFEKHFRFNPEVNVVDLTPVDKMLITSPEAAARMQVDGPPPASPQAYASFTSFSDGPQDGRAFVDACLAEPPPAPQEMPAPSFEPGNPQDIVGMQEFPCNVCLFFPSQITEVCAPKPGVASDYPCDLAINGMPCTDPCENVPVSPSRSVNLKQVLFPVSQSGLPADRQWMCNAFEKFGCFDLCRYDPNSSQPLTITQSAVDKIGARCRDATGGSDPSPQGLPCGSAADCDDGNPCTVKTCSGPEINTCSITNSDGPCDDGLFCNGADTCALGICGAHAGNPCSATAKCCNEATDTCPASCPGTPCGDRNLGDACDDGTVCTTTDHCVSSIAGLQCRGDLAVSCASSTCTAGLCADVQGQPQCVSVSSGACPPGCGNGTLDPDEQCDGVADAACPGKCLPDCSCPPPQHMDGDPCQAASECASQNCVDGVCCNTPCAGALEQCDLPGHVGTCAAIAAKAPTLSLTALLAALAAVVAVAGLALRRTRHQRDA